MPKTAFFLALLCATIMYAADKQPPVLTLDHDLGVYAPGEAIRLAIEASTPPAELWLKDFYGQEQRLERGSSDPDGRREIPAGLPAGYYTVELRPAGIPSAKSLGQVALAVIPPAELPVGPNPFGAMVFPHIAYPLADRERDARLMERIGLRWVRTGRITWQRTQASPTAELNWKESDQDLEIWARHRIEVIATPCSFVPPWFSAGRDEARLDARTKTLLTPAPEYLPLLQKYLRELADRYKGKIAYYEIGNEVDALNFWKGRLESCLNHDRAGAMKDFYDYYYLARDALRAGDPLAQVGPNITGHSVDGVHYHPWLKTMLDLGLGDRLEVMSLHYSAELDKFRAAFGEKHTQLPYILTEIGGIVRGVRDPGPWDPAQRGIIRGDWEQCTQQFSRHATAMCKFLFREQNTYGGEGRMAAGLVAFDFSLRPPYVAFATLVRTLVGAEFIRELNLIDRASAGWLKVYEFTRAGQTFNVVFLYDADRAQVELPLAEGSVASLGDVMGRTRELTAQAGKLTFGLDDLPVILTGKLQDTPSAPTYPGVRLVEEVKLPIVNGGFNAPSEPDRPIPGWGVMYDENRLQADRAPSGFTADVDNSLPGAGRGALRLAATGRTEWYGVIQDLDWARLPQPQADQYLVFKFAYRQKCDKVAGIGGGYSLSLRNAQGERLLFFGAGEAWIGGTFDWQNFTGESQVKALTPGASRLTLELYLGQSTGTVWFDDLDLQVQLWEKETARRP